MRTLLALLAMLACAPTAGAQCQVTTRTDDAGNTYYESAETLLASFEPGVRDHRVSFVAILIRRPLDRPLVPVLFAAVSVLGDEPVAADEVIVSFPEAETVHIDADEVVELEEGAYRSVFYLLPSELDLFLAEDVTEIRFVDHHANRSLDVRPPSDALREQFACVLAQATDR